MGTVFQAIRPRARFTLASMAMRRSPVSGGRGGTGCFCTGGPAGMGPKYLSTRPLTCATSRSPAMSNTALLGA